MWIELVPILAKSNEGVIYVVLDKILTMFGDLW
jgi:hypothetical protein